MKTAQPADLCISHETMVLYISCKMIAKGLLARCQLLIINVDLPMHLNKAAAEGIQASMLVRRYGISSVYDSIAETHEPPAQDQT